MPKREGSKKIKKRSVMLTVVDALSEDAGLGITTLNQVTQEELGVRSGDIVQISFNGENAVAVVEPGSHKSASHTALSRSTHDLLGVTTGNQIRVSKPAVSNAKKVTLRPSIRLPDSIEVPGEWSVHLRNHLSESSLTEGAKVWVPLEGMECRFNVIDVMPKGVVRVTKDTEFEIEE
ncbi:MAG: hypothetical protein M1569_03885 [Candidatus Marsarchaeota archaeon]|nr:hypothetical protein [Candidatus Marsarchaeota archaeon]